MRSNSVLLLKVKLWKIYRMENVQSAGRELESHISTSGNLFRR